ncbi:MAG: hypothetical protein ACE5GL_03930 [Calditrichia bacterium]
MYSKKEYERKIVKLEKFLQEKEKKLSGRIKESQTLRKELKYLRRRLKGLTQSRDSWKAKHKSKQLKIKLLKGTINRQGKAKRHQYPIWLVALCVRLRIDAGSSYESICKILVILQTSFHLSLPKLPCANTIQNWVSKVGLYSMKNMDADLENKELSLIPDESIRLGEEKQLLILAVPWQKQKQRALSFEDVKVVYMKGSKSWDGVKISKVIDELKAKRGFEVKNVLSDENGNLKKAARLSGLVHLPEISHVVATCLRRTFGQDSDYKAFTKTIASYQSRGVNQDLSYLCPPKQRTKARFMNQQGIVNWAEKMLKRFEGLNQKEKEFFSQLAQHQAIITVLATCLSIAKKVSLLFKQLGLSGKTLGQAREIIKTVDRKEAYVNTFLKHLEGYLAQYQQFMNEHGEGSVHASSEIIESMFGKYKDKANNYALTGITNLNLELPLYCLEQENLTALIPFALENTFMSHLEKWKNEHSTDNQLVKRIKFFKKRA